MSISGNDLNRMRCNREQDDREFLSQPSMYFLEEYDSDFNWEDLENINDSPTFDVFENEEEMLNVKENFSNNTGNSFQGYPTRFNDESMSYCNNFYHDKEKNENNQEEDERKAVRVEEKEREDEEDDDDFDFNFEALLKDNFNLFGHPQPNDPKIDPLFYLFQQNESKTYPDLPPLELNRIKLESKAITNLVSFIVQSLYKNTIESSSVPLTIISLRLNIPFQRLIQNIKGELLLYSNETLRENLNKFKKLMEHESYKLKSNSINENEKVERKESSDGKEEEALDEERMELDSESSSKTNLNEEKNKIIEDQSINDYGDIESDKQTNEEKENDVSSVYISWLCTLYLKEKDNEVLDSLMRLINEAKGTLNMDVWNRKNYLCFFIFLLFNFFLLDYVVQTINQFIVTFLTKNSHSFDSEAEIRIPIGKFSDVLQEEVFLFPSLRIEYRSIKH